MKNHPNISDIFFSIDKFISTFFVIKMFFDNFNYCTILFSKIMLILWRAVSYCTHKIQWFPSNMLIFGQQSCFLRKGSDKIIYWLGRYPFLIGFIMSKNVRSWVNFGLEYKTTNLLGFFLTYLYQKGKSINQVNRLSYLHEPIFSRIRI